MWPVLGLPPAWRATKVTPGVLTGVWTPGSVLCMETRTATLTQIALAKVDGRVRVTANGVTLGTVKNGGNFVQNAEKILKAHGVLRATGYRLQDGDLVADGVQV